MTAHAVPTHCPWCGIDNALATGLVNAPNPPEAGDVSICIQCHWPALFDEELELRRPDPLELEELRANPDVARVIAAHEEAARRSPP